ncbi:MAG TPA: Do family serine endopeptidase [Devosiaceae bacterium]|nr:Do family serine endopeptidase [Devosiaceae bacterium]
MRWVVSALAAVLLAVAAAGNAQADVPAPSQGPPPVSALAKKLLPAVVNVSSTHLAGTHGHLPPKSTEGLPPEDDSQNGATGGQADPDEDTESLGSGFIVSADGLVVTNYHVVAGADQVQVSLTDGSHFPARVVGTDAKTDLAVLRIDAGHPLAFVNLGDSDTAEVGDWVMAIGNPFGLDGSVTLGIVSARNRNIQSGPYDSYIQTDASINQGNSGGPLFDMNGNVIGINTAIVAEGGASIGIGFAIPIDLAKPVVVQLEKYGEARRAWLGVDVQDVTDDIAASLGRSDTHGAMVTDVTKPGPAAGLVEEGDIILDFDGKPVDSMHDLPRVVAETEIGKAVPIKVVRDGKEQVVTVTLGRLKEDEPVSSLGSTETKPAPKSSAPLTLDELLGFRMAPIDSVNRKTYALPEAARGLVITSVKSGSEADQNGLVAGLVVTGVNQKQVSKVTEVEAIVDTARKQGRKAVLFRVVDPSGARRFIGVKLTG